jgi:hypothetical protein
MMEDQSQGERLSTMRQWYLLVVCIAVLPDDLNRSPICSSPQDFDPLSVAPEWRMWAKGQLSSPPKDEDVARSEAQRANTVKLAEELDAEEQKRKEATVKAAESQPKLAWDPTAGTKRQN